MYSQNFCIFRVTWQWNLPLLALSILTCSPNMSFLARLVLNNSESLEKLDLGAPSFPATPKEKLSAQDQSSCSWQPDFRFDFHSSINFRAVSPNWRPITLIRTHPRGSRVVPLHSTDMISCESLIVPEAVSCTVSEIWPSTCTTSLY